MTLAMAMSGLSATVGEVLSAQAHVGLVGLIVTNGHGYPVIAVVIPDGPADNEGALRPGDEITAVRSVASSETAVSTLDMSTTRLEAMLRGPVGSLVEISAVRRRGFPDVRQMSVWIRRADVCVSRPDSGVLFRGLGTKRISWSAFPISADEVRRARHVPPSDWTAITNGTTCFSVVQRIGEPLHVGKGQHDGQSAWYYGWLVHYGDKTLEPGTTALFVTNGVVEETFGVKAPEDPLMNVEVLSKPRE